MSVLVHILRSRGWYIGQVRRRGAKRWDTVTGRCASDVGALRGLAGHMNGMWRGRVLFIDSSGWYEPHIVMEVKR